MDEPPNVAGETTAPPLDADATISAAVTPNEPSNNNPSQFVRLSDVHPCRLEQLAQYAGESSKIQKASTCLPGAVNWTIPGQASLESFALEDDELETPKEEKKGLKGHNKRKLCLSTEDEGALERESKRHKH